jgi:serine/threonine-protein kinase
MIGKQIGPYIIQEKLGEGGMGVVYKGIHKDIEQTVAIKVLYPQYAKDENFRERFKREAKVQAKLHHPNVVNILNYLEDEDGNMYIVMEYVGGGSLEDKMRTGKISLSDSVSVIIQVLNALSYMHSNGIIHRDIKPSNIMFADSIVKVSDFGIAKPMSDKGLTKTGAIVGTVWYMAPEIIKGEAPTPASDLYAVGVILYQLLTGRTPFYGKTDFEVMKSHLEKEPQPPETLNPNLPPGTWDLVKKALAKSPRERFSSADEFKQALIDWFSRVEDPQKIKSVDLTSLQSFQINNVKKVAINKKYILIGIIFLLILSLSFVVVLLLSQRKEKPKDVPGLLKIDTPPAQPIQASPPKQEHQTTTSQTGVDEEKQEKTQQEKPQKEMEKPKKQVRSGTYRKTTQENQPKGEDKRAEEKPKENQQKEEGTQKRVEDKPKETQKKEEGGPKWEVIK